jgi:hypothetical protein
VEAVADVTPQRAPSNAVGAQEVAKSKPGGAKKYWSRAKPLTKVDGRSVAAKRIAELRQLFTAT